MCWKTRKPVNLITIIVIIIIISGSSTSVVFIIIIIIIIIIDAIVITINIVKMRVSVFTGDINRTASYWSFCAGYTFSIAAVAISS